ncbi:14566_t:CDS:2, partial [Acaulospora colombiana]
MFIPCNEACLINNGIQERGSPWYCQRCVSNARHDIYLSSNNNVEGNSKAQMNPLHLLLEASDQLQSNSGSENDSAIVHSHFARRDNAIAQQHEKNLGPSRANLVNSEESTPSRPPIAFNLNIDPFNGSSGGGQEETEIAIEKFECQYTSFDE